MVLLRDGLMQEETKTYFQMKGRVLGDKEKKYTAAHVLGPWLGSSVPEREHASPVAAGIRRSLFHLGVSMLHVVSSVPFALWYFFHSILL